MRNLVWASIKIEQMYLCIELKCLVDWRYAVVDYFKFFHPKIGILFFD